MKNTNELHFNIIQFFLNWPGLSCHGNEALVFDHLSPESFFRPKTYNWDYLYQSLELSRPGQLTHN